METDYANPEAVRELFSAEGALSKEAKNRILASGPELVDDLAAILRDRELWDESAPGDGWAPINAAELLGEIEAPEAIEDLFWVVAECEPDAILYTTATEALQRHGEAIVKPGVQILRDRGESFREDLACVFAGLDVRRRVVFQVLVKHFVKNPAVGAMNLAEYGDPEALDALEVVFDKYLVAASEDPSQAQTIRILADAIEQLGGEISEEAEATLETLEERKPASQRVMERVKAGERPSLQAETTHVNDRDVGRNEPCWCGSGRKYKHCHWAEDNRAEQ